MDHRKRGILWASIVVLGFVAPYAGAATERISLFKGVEIPFDFKSGDTVISRGKYDLEIHFSKVDTNYLYILKLLRKGQWLYDIPGQRIEYQALTLQDLAKDPKIPEKPTIRIRKLPTGNLVDFIYESGKTGNMPFEKAFFRVQQVEQ
jgi:hypothetical protein